MPNPRLYSATIRPQLFLIFLLLIGACFAEQPAVVQRVGAALVNGQKSLSFWVVESQAGDRGVVLKVGNLDSQQEVNMLLDREQSKELKGLLKKAFRFREKLGPGDSRTLGTLVTRDMSLEVLVVRADSFTVRILALTEKGNTIDYYLDSFQEDRVMGALQQSSAWLR